MNRAFGKRERRFLSASVWFLTVPALISLLIVAWRHVRTIVTFGAVLLIPTLCYVETIEAQSNGKRGQEPPQVVSSGAYLLGRPNNGGPVVVRATFQLQDITEIDDQAETFQFTGLLTLTWQDKRQAFDPDKERVQEKLYQGDYQFNELSPAWYPQVVLANESGMYEKHGVLLRVQPDGTSTLIESINATAKANFNMRRYPFDAQRLEAIFEVLGFDSSEVVFEAESTLVDPSWQEVRISQWQLVGIRGSTSEHIAPSSGKRGTSSTFTVRMNVQRNSFFVVRLVVFPLTMIVVLSWSVFWMDRSTLGDRINISFVGILTAVAYQFVVGGILPHISYVTLMNAFMNLSFLTMCATVVVNLVVGQYDKKGKSDVGNLIDYRCRWIFPLVYFGLLLLMVAISFILF
jgi:hypothetical protein